MAKGKFVTYYRVSTKKQGESGLGLKAQQKAVTDYLNGGNWKLVAEFTEVESGKSSDRAELLAAIEYCKLTNSVLLVAKLCRLSRNIAFLTALMESGVEFVCADNPNANRLTIHVLAACAEQERVEISKRTKLALAQSLNKERVNNLPEASAKTAQHARAALVTKANTEAEAYREIITPLVCEGLSGISRILNGKNITTPKGGKWYPSSVKNIMTRLGLLS